MSGRPERRTQAQRSEETRARLIDAAVEVLASDGYAGLRVAEVARRAGVSRGAQTHHFPSRSALVEAVAEHVFRKSAQLGHPRTQRARTPDEGVKALLRDAQDLYFSELFLIALDLGIQVRAESGDLTGLARVSEHALVPVEKVWLASLIESGVPAKVAEDLLWLTVSVVRGLAVRRLWQDDTPRFRRLFQRWRDMVTAYLESLQRA